LWIWETREPAENPEWHYLVDPPCDAYPTPNPNNYTCDCREPPGGLPIVGDFEGQIVEGSCKCFDPNLQDLCQAFYP
jgi:hypothetical protein